jgi:hypothetical protein
VEGSDASSVPVIPVGTRPTRIPGTPTPQLTGCIIIIAGKPPGRIRIDANTTVIATMSRDYGVASVVMDRTRYKLLLCLRKVESSGNEGCPPDDETP